MKSKLPRSYAEAVELHPGIASIDDERAWTPREDGFWTGPPFVCNLNPGWTWDGLNHFGFSGLQELRDEWDRIVYGPEQTP